MNIINNEILKPSQSKRKRKRNDSITSSENESSNEEIYLNDSNNLKRNNSNDHTLFSNNNDNHMKINSDPRIQINNFNHNYSANLDTQQQVHKNNNKGVNGLSVSIPDPTKLFTKTLASPISPTSLYSHFPPLHSPTQSFIPLFDSVQLSPINPPSFGNYFDLNPILPHAHTLQSQLKQSD